MNILVTGYPGFLAMNLANYLSCCTPGLKLLTQHKWFFSHNRDKDNLQCDLLCPNNVETFIDEKQPDVIIHLAASCDMSEPDPVAHYQNNIVMASNLMNYAPTGCRFVFASSSTVYGNGYGRPSLELDPLIPNSEYGAAKLACETLLYAYGWQKRLSGVSLRFPSIVGPNMTHGMLRDVLRKLRSKEDKSLYLLGKNPGSIKPYLHSSIAVKALLEFSVGNLKNMTGPFNVSPTDSLSVLEVANIAMEKLGINKEIEFSQSTWAGDNPYVSLNNYKVEVDCGFPINISSKDAIRKAIDEN